MKRLIYLAFWGKRVDRERLRGGRIQGSCQKGLKKAGGKIMGTETTQNSVTSTTQNSVWQNMVDADRLVRYYQALFNRYQRNHNLIRFTSLIGATSVVASLIDLIPENYRRLAQVIAGIAIPVAVTLDFRADYSKKIWVLQQINTECDTLRTEWQTLWDSIEAFGVEDEEARKKNDELNQRLTTVTALSIKAGIRTNNKLNSKCQKEAEETMAQRYPRTDGTNAKKQQRRVVPK